MTRTLLAAALVAFSSVATAQPVAVTLTEWKVELARDTVRAGLVTFRVKNGGAMAHAFHVVGQGVDKESRSIAVGQIENVTVTFKPGTYEVYCPMSEDSHKKAGMVHKVTVVEAAAPAPPKKPES